MAKYDFTNETPFNEQPLYKQGYEDAIDKACEWFISLLFDGYDYDKYFQNCNGVNEFIDDFRKAMEE